MGLVLDVKALTGACRTVYAPLFQALESYSQAVRWGAGRSSLTHIAKIQQELGHPQKALQAAQRCACALRLADPALALAAVIMLR